MGEQFVVGLAEEGHRFSGAFQMRATVSNRKETANQRESTRILKKQPLGNPARNIRVNPR
jgi:hypothetical protein